MTTPKQHQKLDAILKKAAEFHGHLGPFLVIGVKMGLIGVRELKMKKDENQLRVKAMLEYSIPFSCALDGIQVATRCTIGNQKLELIESPGIAAEFELQREKLSVTVNPTILNRLESRLHSENATTEEMRKLAKIIAAMPEKQLFTKKNARATLGE